MQAASDSSQAADQVECSFVLLAESVIGASHLTDGSSCQDALNYRTIRNSRGVYHIAAVADGHGSCQRGDVGARIAVAVFLELAAVLVHILAADEDDVASKSFFNDFHGLFARRLCECWRKKVEEDVLAQSDQRKRAGTINTKAYGTTLTGAIVTPSEVFIGRVGDSDAFLAVGDPDGTAIRCVVPVFKPDAGLVGLEVHGLSSKHPQRNWKVSRASLDAPPNGKVLMLMLATDGFGDCFSEPCAVVHGIAQDSLHRGADWLRSCLKPSLERFTREGVGDDISVILLFPHGIHPTPSSVVGAAALEAPAETLKAGGQSKADISHSTCDQPT